MSLELGPCQVLFGVKDSEEDLGKTEGGVVAHFETDVADLMSDQFGTAPEDQTVTGQKASVSVPLAENSLDILALALNQTKKALLTDEGIAGVNVVGTKMKETKAQSLLLKKYVGGIPSEDPADWLRFPAAAPSGKFDYSYSKDKQRIITVDFVAFPDDDGILYYFGDETAAVTGS
jgi:hypothetical protein